MKEMERIEKKEKDEKRVGKKDEERLIEDMEEDIE